MKQTILDARRFSSWSKKAEVAGDTINAKLIYHSKSALDS